MSFGIDVNVLLYASDVSSPRFKTAEAFLGRCAAGPDVVFLAWQTVFSYIRMATHPTIFRSPLSHEQAAANIERLVARPHVRLLSEMEGFWAVYREVTRSLSPRGNAVPDAYLACILKQNGVRVLYTSDADFRRFPFLEPRDPFAA